jgi:hypothetical protein
MEHRPADPNRTRTDEERTAPALTGPLALGMKVYGTSIPMRFRSHLRLILAIALSSFVHAPATEAPQIAPLATTAPSGNAGLFVGVNDFDDETIKPLSYAVNDVVALAHVFVLHLRLIPPTNCTLLIAGHPTTEPLWTQFKSLTNSGVRLGKATRTTFLREVARLREFDSGPENLLVVGIGTHGYEEGVENAYVMPSDGLLSLLEDSALNIRKIEAHLEKSAAGKKLVLVDACRERFRSDTRGPDSGVSEAFWRAFEGAQGQGLLTSCDRRQVSVEDKGLAHGVFTHFFVEGLRGGAIANSQGFITLGSVVSFVQTNVGTWVRKNRPGLDPILIQNPRWEGPTTAFAIPLAIDSRISQQRKQFRQEVDVVIQALKGKIQRKGDAGNFTYELFDKLANELEGAAPDDAGQALLRRSQAFAASSVDDEVFVAYLEKALGTALPTGQALRIQANQTLALLRSRVGISGFSLELWEFVERKMAVILRKLQEDDFPGFAVTHFKKELRQMREFADNPTSQQNFVSGLKTSADKDNATCQSQLRGISFEVLKYAFTNNGVLPPNLLALSNLIEPDVLTCPIDPSHSSASSWRSVTQTNITYEYKVPSAVLKYLTTNHIVLRCPLHGAVAMANSTVLSTPPANSIDSSKLPKLKAFTAEDLK